jgi:hypothetical protein
MESASLPHSFYLKTNIENGRPPEKTSSTSSHIARKPTNNPPRRTGVLPRSTVSILVTNRTKTTEWPPQKSGVLPNATSPTITKTSSINPHRDWSSFPVCDDALSYPTASSTAPCILKSSKPSSTSSNMKSSPSSSSPSPESSLGRSSASQPSKSKSKPKKLTRKARKIARHARELEAYNQYVRNRAPSVYGPDPEAWYGYRPVEDWDGSQAKARERRATWERGIKERRDPEELDRNLVPN